MNTLKQQVVRGGAIKLVNQGLVAILRVGSILAMARLLNPSDFGLVGMVTAVIGILSIFKDFGLSAVTVQKQGITKEEVSGLFWINVGIGATLMLCVVAAAPLIARFYNEPKLLPIGTALSTVFLISAAGIQHSAMLEKNMRFATTASIELLSLIGSIAVGIGMALAGAEYWSLVGMAIAAPLIVTAGVWGRSDWTPSAPRQLGKLLPTVRSGGLLTLNGIVVYVAYNTDKVLVARLWGAEALGLYGRAYQLASIPVENLNAAAGSVALSGLARVAGDATTFRNYFLKGYSLLVSVTMVVTAELAVFSDDLIAVLLGPKWAAAAPLFRLLCPTILAFGLINPLGPFLIAQGLFSRSLLLAAILAPVVIVGCLAGSMFGLNGVAIGFSTALCLWVVPHMLLAVRGTSVSAGSIFRAIAPPAVAAVFGACAGLAVQYGWHASFESSTLRLLVGSLALVVAYGAVLLVGFGQWRLFLGLVQGLRPSAR